MNMSRNQKLVLEWLRVYMKENDESAFNAIGEFIHLLHNGGLTNEMQQAYIMLEANSELQILRKLGDEKKILKSEVTNHLKR